MPGLRLTSFWEGDRAEIFAQYMLSSIAAVVPVPRQVDFGFDFLCTLVHREEAVLHTGMSFGVQVKSPSTSKTRYGGFDQDGKWKGHEIAWLYGQSQPLVLCVADLRQLEIKLYNTSRVWWVRGRSNHPTEVVLLPDKQASLTLGEDLCPRRIIRAPAEGQGDGYSYQIPLGEPIVWLNLKEQASREEHDAIGRCLNDWLALAHRNISHHRMGVAYFEDVLKYSPNIILKPVLSYQYFTSTHENQIRTILHAIGPAIESLTRNLMAQNRSDKLREVIPMARLAKAYGVQFWSQVDKAIEEPEH